MEKVWAEIDPESGRARVVTEKTHSVWGTYQGVASLLVNGMTYYAVSAYYEGTFPVGKAFRILVQEVG